MVGGISFQVNEVQVVNNRAVKKFLAVLAQVGGMLRMGNLVFGLLLFFTKTWGGEKYLVSRMYKMMLSKDELEERRETERRNSESSSSSLFANPFSVNRPSMPILGNKIRDQLKFRNDQDELIVKAKDSFERRDRVKIAGADRCMELYRKIFFCFCCFPKKKLTERDYAYKKATHKLTAELDIKRIMNSLRVFRSALKFLTTSDQRKLIRMQAANNVIEVRPEEYENLTKPIPSKDYWGIMRQLKEDSDFTSENQDEFITNLKYPPGVKPTVQEMNLIRGVMPPYDRMKNGAELFAPQEMAEEENAAMGEHEQDD